MSQPSHPFVGILLLLSLASPARSWAENPDHEQSVAHSGNPLKLGFGYAGGLLNLNPHSGVGMNGAQILTGWEFEPSDKIFLMPFLIGGFGILTEEGETHPSDPAAKSRIAGLFGIGMSGGPNFGPLSPYLAVEGFALPGFGFSVGFGAIYHLHRLVAIDVAVHWIRIPDTSKPFGISTPGASANASLNELGFFVGFEL